MIPLLCESCCSTTIVTILSALGLLYLYFKYAFTYWERQSVPCIQPEIPFGNLKPFIFVKKSVPEIVAEIYYKFKESGKPFAGLYVFWKPNLVLIDPEMVKLVWTKEFQHFHARPIKADIKNDPLSGHLLNMNGDEWKFMRRTLTPTFTSGKMKMMFQTIAACSKNIEVVLEKHSKTGEPLDVKDTMGRFTTDIIGSCAFGIECNSMKEPDNIFRKQGIKIFQRSTIQGFKDFFINTFPTIAAMLKMKHVTEETESFFMNIVKNTIQYREDNNISRKDFLDILMQLRTGDLDEKGENKAAETGKLTIEQIAAQSFVFFTAGFETSSTSLSNILYELCLHPDIQNKTRQEIRDVLQKHNGEMTYEAIMDMKYLEQVIDESMRMHSVAPQLGRECVKDYTFPNGVTIKKGQIAFISTLGLHMDPEYYPNPKVFNPDRFSAEEKAKRHPYVFLPFGEGPRSCIGLRFGMLQMKVGLVALLKNYKFTLNSKTIEPLMQNPRSFLLNYVGGIWVDAQKVE